MKKTVIFALLTLCLSATAVEPKPVQATACDPTAIGAWTLQYVAAQYGVDGSYCYRLMGSVFACNYVNGAIAALVQIPTTAKTQAIFCSQVSDWYNCPLSGTGCVLTARVRCSGFVGVNWRDQCSRSAL